ncbi:4a-hydroxytetrahydrobiopterin dehydratase [Sphingomicrobium sediminis]|uniref:Putative pterin-4-alpha-carbinolamine dehydratase n=1 Tax=Sphingomicrobium sediminis TaxID=2950949 RepID=A0A9X2EIU1_9SPHN|nr:4a-hydroxytetrahydrobiopterin dehydratase [Sphingomicrobium sediminis]MCM8558261.1 4a-hydroxytetrahydrobiopterin dehydratase [Sphingomicrobium sediminis]
MEFPTSWTKSDDGKAITRRFEFADFSGAFAFLTRVAMLAEKADHHPEIENVWNKVTLTLTTHDAGGLTGKDADLAAQIDELVA